MAIDPTQARPEVNATWIAALRAAAEVARRGSASERELLKGVTQALRALQLQGGVSYLLESGELELQSWWLPATLSKALERLTRRRLSGFRFDPKSVATYRQAFETRQAVFSSKRGAILVEIVPAGLRRLVPQILKLLGDQPVIVAPLMLADRIIGAITVHAPWLSPEDAPMVTALADHVAIAIGNVRARKTAQEAIQRERLRSEIGQAISSELDLNLVMDRIVRLAARYTGADASAIALLNASGEFVGYPYLFGLPEELSRRPLVPGRGLVWELISKREPILITDYRTHPSALPEWTAAGIRAFLGVPLFIDREPIGAMGLFKRQPGETFDARHVHMAEDIARMAAIAVKNARLFEAERTQRRLAETLLKTTGDLSSSLEMTPVLEQLLKSLAEVVHYDSAAVMLVEGDDLCVRAARGYADMSRVRALRIPIAEDALFAEMRRTSRPIIVGDSDDPRFRDLGGSADVRTLMGVPLKWHEQILGALTLESRQPQAYTESDAEVVRAFANQAAAAVQNAALFSETRHRAEELQALIRTAQSISASLDLDTVLNAIAEQARELFQADGSRIHMIDHQQRKLRCLVALDPSAPAVAQMELDLGEGLVGHAALTGEPIIVNDPINDHRSLHVPGTPEDEPESLAIAPLITRQRTIGVMTVRRLGSDRPFGPDDLELLTALAAQAAVAIENADLYGQIESQALRLEVEVEKRTRELGLSEARYRALVETAVAGIFQTDREGRLVYINKAFVQLVGRSEDSLLGEYAPELVAPDQRDRAWERYTARLSGERPLRDVTESDLIAADGRRIPVLLAVSLIADENGAIQGTTGLVLDISKRKLLEAALRAERDRLNAILTNVADAVMVTDETGRIEYVNPAWEQLTRYPAQEALGQTPSLLKSEKQPRSAYAELWDTILRGESWLGELINRRRDGTTYDAVVSATPVLDEDGEIVNFVSVQHDISALKEIDRLKSQFVSDVSHELRTPLTNIRLYVDLLGATEDRGKSRRYLRTLTRESDRLTYLIDDLLSLSRLEARTKPLSTRPVDINELLEALVEDRRTLASQRGLDLRLDADEHLPAAPGDERLLIQVFTNLLTNAMNYTPNGGQITLRTYRTAERGQDWVAVEVEDTGLGISSDEQGMIFGRFFRGMASQETGAPGTGLGLAICKQITERHGGKLAVESELGRGSRFTVRLPALNAHGTEQPSPSSPAELASDELKE